MLSVLLSVTLLLSTSFAAEEATNDNDRVPKQVGPKFGGLYRSPRGGPQAGAFVDPNVDKREDEEYYKRMASYVVPDDKDLDFEESENDKNNESLFEIINKKYPIIFGIIGGFGVFMIVGFTLFTFVCCATSKRNKMN